MSNIRRNHIVAWVLLIGATLLASACVTQKACYRKFPPTVIEHIRDSSGTQTKQRDSIHVIVTPAQEFKHKDTIPECPTLNKKGSIKLSGINISYEIKDGSLVLSGKIPESKTEYRDRWRDSISYRNVYKDKIVQLPPVVEYRMPWWGWLIIIVMGIMLIGCLKKIVF